MAPRRRRSVRVAEELAYLAFAAWCARRGIDPRTAPHADVARYVRSLRRAAVGRGARP